MTARGEWVPPDVIAEYDQGLAKTGRELDLLLKILRIGIREASEIQAAAGLAALLQMRHDLGSSQALLLAALLRLARKEPA